MSRDVTLVKMRHDVNSESIGFVGKALPMIRAVMPTALEAIAERLRLSREALGYTQATMASIIGSSASLWANYESGTRRISLDKAFRLKASTKLTLEWIYYGDLSGLPPNLQDALTTAMAKKK